MNPDLVGVCRTCDRLPGCPLLMTNNEFDPEKTVERSGRACDEWSEMHPHLLPSRLKILELADIEGVRAIHMFYTKEEEDQMHETPDFASMLREGMTASEREEQLRYETDSKGRPLLDEKDAKIPRSAFPLRKYAADPGGPVQKPNRTVMFWSQDQLIDAILKAEAAAGLIQGKVTKRKAAAPAAAPARKEEPMAEVKRTIALRRPVTTQKSAEEEAPAETPAASKVSTPATGKRKVVTKASNGSAVPSKANDEAPAAAAPADSKAIEALKKEVEGLKKSNADVLAALGELRQLVIDIGTIQHDVFVQQIKNVLIQTSNLLTEQAAEIPESADEASLLGATDEKGNAQPLDILSYIAEGN